MNDELVDFFTSLLKYKSAIIEPAGDGVVQILVPPDVAASLGVNELFLAAFEPEKSEKALLVAYGTPVVDALRSIIEKEGRFIAVSLPDLYVKSGNIDREISRVFTFPRGRLHYLDSRPMTVSCLIFNFRYSALSDERFEGVKSVAVSESSLAVIDGMLEKLVSELPYTVTAESADEPAPYNQQQCYGKACRFLQRAVEIELSDFRKSMRHRLSRDIHRLHDYYEGMLKELNTRKKKFSNLTEEAKTAQKEAVHMEFNAKCRELVEKYSIKVTSRLFSVCRVFMPASVSRVELRTGAQTVNLTFFWNALAKEFEPLVCSQCHGDTYEIYLDGRKSLLCRSCADA
jgi:hypothetical protein